MQLLGLRTYRTGGERKGAVDVCPPVRTALDGCSRLVQRLDDCLGTLHAWLPVLFLGIGAMIMFLIIAVTVEVLKEIFKTEIDR